MLSRKKKIAALNNHGYLIVYLCASLQSACCETDFSTVLFESRVFESRDRSHQANILIVLL